MIIDFNSKKFFGFTLVELLIVIAVIAVLSALTFVALNPLARFQDSRNAQRWNDVNALLSAVKLYQVDNNGAYHDNITAMTDNTYYQIGDDTSGCNIANCANSSGQITETACVDLGDLFSEGYIGKLPLDPSLSGSAEDKSGYYIYKYDSGQVAIGSCYSEQGSNSSIPLIEVIR